VSEKREERVGVWGENRRARRSRNMGGYVPVFFFFL